MKSFKLFTEKLYGAVKADHRTVFAEGSLIKEALYDANNELYQINEIGEFNNVEKRLQFVNMDNRPNYTKLRRILLNKITNSLEKTQALLKINGGVYVSCPAHRTPLVPKGYKIVWLFGCHAMAFKDFEKSKKFFKELKENRDEKVEIGLHGTIRVKK